MATTQLRPMAMGEILDASFALLRHHAGVFFGVAIVCQGVPTALSLFVEFGGGPSRHLGLYLAAKLLNFMGYLLVTGASIRVELAEFWRYEGDRIAEYKVIYDQSDFLAQLGVGA